MLTDKRYCYPLTIHRLRFALPGFFDHESNRFECAKSQFAAKGLLMSSV